MAENKGFMQYWQNMPGTIKALHVLGLLLLIGVALVLFIAPAAIAFFTLIGLL